MLTKFFHAVRFAVGLTLLVVGVAALVPIATDLLGEPVSRPDLQADSGTPAPPETTLFGHAIPDPYAGSPGWAAGGDARPTEHPPSLQAGASGSPPGQSFTANAVPSPPPRLPTSFPGVVTEMPGMSPLYRSPLDVPPPPLLDEHGPPPTAPGWAAHGKRPQASPVSQAMPSLPATYTVRDGDDLTTLALRLYGHPGAAAAILAANRDQLADPQILPIGMRLRLPPPWTVSSGRHGPGTAAIEPGPGGNRPPIIGQASASPPQPWMSATPAGDQRGR
jgi:phage tail protein X